MKVLVLGGDGFCGWPTTLANIAPADDRPLTLDERLARFDPARHGGEVMTTEPVGAERW